MQNKQLKNHIVYCKQLKLINPIKLPQTMINESLKMTSTMYEF